MSISDRLAAITARAESVMTPAPWTSHTYPDGGGRVYGADGYELPGCFNCGSNDDAIYEDGDAEFIAAARSDVPWLVEQVRKRDEAIQAVLDLHKPDGHDPQDSAICPPCAEYHPCPTVRAVTAALGQEAGDE